MGEVCFGGVLIGLLAFTSGANSVWAVITESGISMVVVVWSSWRLKQSPPHPGIFMHEGFTEVNFQRSSWDLFTQSNDVFAHMLSKALLLSERGNSGLLEEMLTDSSRAPKVRECMLKGIDSFQLGSFQSN